MKTFLICLILLCCLYGCQSAAAPQSTTAPLAVSQVWHEIPDTPTPNTPRDALDPRGLYCPNFRDGKLYHFSLDDLKNAQSPQPLTEFSAFESSPAPLVWSPNGKLAALVREPNSQPKAQGSLEIFDAGTGNWQVALHGNFYNTPVWSPDSNRLILISASNDQSVSGGENELWLFDVVTGNSHRIAPDATGIKSDVRWLDTDTLIFFALQEDLAAQTTHSNFYQFNLATNTLQNLSKSVNLNGLNSLTLLPNGQTMFSALNATTGMFALYTATRSPFEIIERQPLYSTFWVSLDGAWILTTGENNPRTGWADVSLINTTTWQSTSLPLTGELYNVLWDENGSALIFFHATQDSLWHLQPPQNLERLQISDSPNWQNFDFANCSLFVTPIE